MGSLHLGPVLVRQNEVFPLTRKHLGSSTDSGRDREAFLQRLVHDHPRVIPMNEIEPAFQEMQSVCVELPLKTGYLDNLWMTMAGGIVLGECKLFRNPQSRREVIAQALDYARSLQGMSYEQFERQIGRARAEPNFNLYAFLKRIGNDLFAAEISEESTFIDSVSRRLREGRMMVLIIGDGIREGIEELADFLQLHAGIHANIALIDLSIWDLADGDMLIVPRLPMKTATIIRGIVQFSDHVAVSVVDAQQKPVSSTSVSRAVTPSEDEYFLSLERNDPASAVVVRSLCNAIVDSGATYRFTPQYIVFEAPSSGKSRSFFNVKFNGEIWDGSLLANTLDPLSKDKFRLLIGELGVAMGANVSQAETLHRFRLPDGTRPHASVLADKVHLVADIIRRAMDVDRVAEMPQD